MANRARPGNPSAQLKIAAPLMLAYVMDVLGLIITKGVVGRLGHTELGAVGIAADVAFQLAIVTMGFFSVVGVLVAGALGAKRREEVTAALLQGLWLALLIGATLGVLVWNMPHLLRLFGQTEEIIAISRPYAHGMAFSMLPMIVFAVLRGFAAAMMRSGAVLVVTVLSVVMQFGLMRGLVLGEFGLPRLEVAGAGLAFALTTYARCLLLAAAVWWIVRRGKLANASRGSRGICLEAWCLHRARLARRGPSWRSSQACSVQRPSCLAGLGQFHLRPIR